ncbi:MAG TPA: tetratricopeptide repeat protein [Pyrinomonadaceae bacterium]|jgi:tetratricopeptide (TPR) repeat protein|nr:tetratricopeptide repeat protein [Pyrinomonadaceae bacterium]
MRLVVFAVLLFSIAPAISAQTALTITTEPNAIVWIDEIRRGTTDDSGKLVVAKITANRHSVRVRAAGFKETVTPLLPGRRALDVKLVRTTEQAELLFQEAETAREKARDDPDLEKAADLYRQAIKARPAYPAAQVGLARVLMDLNQFKEAHAAIDAARRTRPSYAEASAVEGRLYREEAFGDDAIRSFRRAIREGGGVQPEAYVGLARVYEDKGQFAEAIVEFKKALAQLSDSEPVIYQMIGAAYEKMEKPKEAVAAYEKYLQLAPTGSYAAAIRSILEQLKREAAGEQIIP